MKTVIHLLNTNSFSGAENVVITLIRQMKAEYGKEYKFFYASRPGSIEKILKKEDIDFLPVEKMSISVIKRIFKKYNPQIVHAHDFTASMVSAAAAGKASVISHLHGNPFWIRSYNIKSVSYFLTTFRYYKILTVSNAIGREYIFGKRLKDKILNIGNPVNIAEIQRRAEERDGEKYDIVFLGRLAEPKNPLRFIHIVDNLLKKDVSVSAVMIGDGDLKAECHREIEKSNLQGNITMKGFLDNPYPVLKNAKLLCVTSGWEGFGLMAVEALALKVPVITTDVGGLRDIVNESCGYFCKTDEEFARRIEEILNDDTLREKLSEGASVRAEELNNMQQYSKTMYELYNGIKGKE